MLTTVLTVAALAAAAFSARRWPQRFRPYSEMVRNLSLVMGIVLLAWNIAVALTVLALDAGGLLVTDRLADAERIKQSLIVIGPAVTLAVFGGVYLYLTALDRWSPPRPAAS